MLSGPGAGGRGAREVELHPVAGDGQVERDVQGVVGDAVIVEEILEGIAAIRQGARSRLRISASARSEKASRRCATRRRAVFVEQRVEPALAEIERVELAVEVAPVRHAAGANWQPG